MMDLYEELMGLVSSLDRAGPDPRGVPEPDMSGKAVARRLKDVAQLFRLWCKLKKARIVEGSDSA